MGSTKTREIESVKQSGDGWKVTVKRFGVSVSAIITDKALIQRYNRANDRFDKYGYKSAASNLYDAVINKIGCYRVTDLE